jgi:AbrB family looped-hinge helix DNA binding protein
VGKETSSLPEDEMSTTARVTTKGQVTIPKAVRDEMGLRPGDDIEFVKGSAGYHVKKRMRANPFDKWRGFLKEFEGRDPDDYVNELRGR